MLYLIHFAERMFLTVKYMTTSTKTLTEFPCQGAKIC